MGGGLLEFLQHSFVGTNTKEEIWKLKKEETNKETKKKEGKKDRKKVTRIQKRREGWQKERKKEENSVKNWHGKVKILCNMK